MILRASLVLSLLCCVTLVPARADQVVDGRIGPGALYRLVRPSNWNGRLVLYAHGFVAKGQPVALPAEADLLASLLVPQGFAVAYSSFSENGWAVRDGVQRTLQLIGLFTSTFGPPTGVYLGGASMGGLIAIEMAERFPERFIGVLPACAVAGGTRAQYDYLANTRALFDVFYPGVLPGDAGHLPPGTDVTTQIVLPALTAIGASPLGALTLAAVTQTPVPFASGAELAQSVVTALAGHAGSFDDLVPELAGRPYFDNSTTLYTGALPPSILAGINAGVGRFEASPAALSLMAKQYAPTGRLAMPMLTLSNSRDPVVPGFHRAAYGQLVTAAGNGARLVQRTVDRYGHCDFTPAELATAFFDLVAWVEFGVPPAP
ncbi:MAG: hypothetical protein AB7O28_20185 [Vicinamibacterales bacterium]